MSCNSFVRILDAEIEMWKRERMNKIKSKIELEMKKYERMNFPSDFCVSFVYHFIWWYQKCTFPWIFSRNYVSKKRTFPTTALSTLLPCLYFFFLVKTLIFHPRSIVVICQLHKLHDVESRAVFFSLLSLFVSSF